MYGTIRQGNTSEVYNRIRNYEVTDNDILRHNLALIENWNKHVNPGDTVFHLGDFCFGNGQDASHYFDLLNGKIVFICGNHDNPAHKIRQRFVSYQNMLELNIEDDTEPSHLHPQRPGDYRSLTLCHYAMRTWNKSHYGSWHLYGHSHGNLGVYNASFDIGVDSVARILQNKLDPDQYIPNIRFYRPMSYFEVRDHFFDITCSSL